MPTYNRPTFVPWAIQYFLRQDYANKELIIVDDGTDTVDHLVPPDTPIRYVRLHGKMTVGDKRNVACEHAKGDILLHWDDDDWHAPNRLSYQVEALLREGAAVCGITTPLFLDLRTGRAWQYLYPSQQRPWLSGSTLCYTRAYWAAHRFPSLDIGEDAQFLWAHHGERMLALPDPSFHVGIIHGGNVAPKDIGTPRWRPYSVDALRRLMGQDQERYRTESAGPARAGVVVAPRASTTSVAVVIICHEPYLRWLPEAMAAVDRQLPMPTERIVVYDRCQPVEAPGPPWRVLTGDWGHPSAARNAGLAASTAPWTIFWDADNVMQDGYIAAMARAAEAAPPDLAILYPDIQYCDERLAPRRLWRTPEWDYWAMRAENCIDTAAAWRREALEVVGAWPLRTGHALEDYVLALDVTAAGWKAARVDAPPVLMRVHPGSRTQEVAHAGQEPAEIWQARSLAIVSLLAGREDVFDRWRRFLLRAELPPRAALYVVDNSGRPEFTRRVHDACRQVAEARNLAHLDISSTGFPYQPGSAEPYFVKNRHLHVARLYASVLPRVTEELVLTLEDDVEPPDDAPRRLGERIGWRGGGQVGAIAAAYAMPQNPALVCAGRGPEGWGAGITWSELASQPLEVGCVGGGCTMWANWALHDLPVHFWWDAGLGWDAALSIQLRRKGYHVWLHGGVRCEHHLHGRLATTGARQQATQRAVPPGKDRLETARLPEPAPATVAVAPPPAPRVAPTTAPRSSELHRHPDSWIAQEDLGSHIPPYRPTYTVDDFVNDRHRQYSTARVRDGALIDVGIPGWLRREDALKLYELAYFARIGILEIGCYHGLSTSILAAAIVDAGSHTAIVSVDLVPAHIDAARGHLARRQLPVEVEFHTGDAAAICERLAQAGRRFDLVFVDHSHRYADVLAICRLLPELLVEGGFCLFHDFNDGRNRDLRNEEYAVSRAVQDGVDGKAFAFYGIYGCCGLYRRLVAQP